MSIEQQLERLNANLEALVGAIAANTSVANAIASTASAALPAGDKPQAAENPLGEAPANPRGAGRPKTVYYRLANGEVVKSSSKDTPVEGAVEITKDEYDAAQVKPPKAETKTEPKSEPAAGTSSVTYTIDDVREVALKYRDKTSQEQAKAHIATFGVASIKDLPEAKFAEFIEKTKALIEGGDDL